jgi:ribulose-5-phosphate 4-epimerase/fuculose-1-phosphate aldolase
MSAIATHAAAGTLGSETASLHALRVDLAAAFRLAVKMDWHESVGNHFSLAVSDNGHRFLLNPKWRHFSLIRASDLLLVDSDDANTLARPDAPDSTAWCIHGQLHRLVPRARCVLHVHPPYATALVTLANPVIKPIEQNTAKYFNRVAYDHGFTGLADNEAEGQRLAAALGDKRTMLMGNHGVLVTGPTVAEAFEELYFLERAAKTLMLAYASGQPLAVLSDEVAERTAVAWEEFREAGYSHYRDLKTLLDREDPSYRD